MADGRGDDLARAQQTKCSGVREQRVSSSSGTVVRVHAKDIRARDPRPREGQPPIVHAGIAGLTVLREGWPPVRGETLGLCQRLDAERNSPAPRSGDTPRPSDAGDQVSPTVRARSARTKLP